MRTSTFRTDFDPHWIFGAAGDGDDVLWWRRKEPRIRYLNAQQEPSVEQSHSRSLCTIRETSCVIDLRLLGGDKQRMHRASEEAGYERPRRERKRERKQVAGAIAGRAVRLKASSIFLVTSQENIGDL